MLSYVTIGTNDSDKANAFYDAVFATIGWAKHADWPGWRGYSEGGSGKGGSVWVCKPHNGEPACVGNGMMVAFGAKSEAEVDGFYAAALANGGTDEGPAGPRPAYGPNWYAAYMRDPTGNKIAIVFNG